jgi:hypothetical protein
MTARKCSVDGCERTPGPGWQRCDSHVRQWLDRLLGVEWRERKEPPAEHVAERPLDELESRYAWGDR